MILTPEQQKTFERAARPLMAWLNENCHPHVSVQVDCTSAELSEGICATGPILDYVKD